jgi:excinuclease ABC subunit C
MMAELVSRRLSHDPLPDLLVVDGGKGHLSAVQGAIRRHQGSATDLPEVVSIAKPNSARKEKADKIYLPGRKNPLLLKRDHPVLLWIMKIRDEAHRRAITYHRGLRRSSLSESVLDQIPGVGKKRKMRLLQHFKDVKTLAGATVADQMAVPGIHRALAQRIQVHLTRLHGNAHETGSLDTSS